MAQHSALSIHNKALNSSAKLTDPTQPIQVFALHGFTGNATDFDLIRPLIESGQATNSLPANAWICPSVLGHRSAPDSDCSAQAQLAHFSQQLKTLDRGTHRRVLLAYSMGARIALLHACQKPKFWDALILISCHPGIVDPTEQKERQKTDEDIANSIIKKGLAWFLPYWQSLPIIETQARAPTRFREKMTVQKKQLSAQGLALCLRQFGQGVSPNLWSAAKAINCPILCLHGSEDTKYAAIHQSFCQSTCKTNPAIQSVTIPSSGHAPHIENHRATAKAIQTFLKELFPSAQQSD